MRLQNKKFALRIKLLIILTLCCTHVYSTEVDSLSISYRLEKLFGRLISEREDSTRLMVNDSIKTIVESMVKTDSIFNFNLQNVRYLGQITSPDSVFKIVSWNLNLKDEAGKYFCYIIKGNFSGERNSIYRLEASYDSTNILKGTIYTADNWYGALYYEIRSQIIDGVKCWILLGINYSNPLITKKVIDVIRFTDDGIILGSNIFSSPEGLQAREVFQYSADATMTLRFTDDKTIVFDHLVPFSPDLEGKLEYYGPDFSYDAFIFEDGIWTFKLDVDAKNEERPTLPPLR